MAAAAPIVPKPVVVAAAVPTAAAAPVVASVQQASAALARTGSQESAYVFPLIAQIH